MKLIYKKHVFIYLTIGKVHTKMEKMDSLYKNVLDSPQQGLHELLTP